MMILLRKILLRNPIEIGVEMELSQKEECLERAYKDCSSFINKRENFMNVLVMLFEKDCTGGRIVDTPILTFLQFPSSQDTERSNLVR